MDDKAKIAELSRATKGARLRYLRELARLDRYEAASITRVAYATYKDWENSKTNLADERAYWFIDELQARGIACSLEWLLEGTGEPPQKTSIFLNTEAFMANISQSNKIDAQQEARQITKELEFFCHNNANSIGLIVADDAMAPVYNKGDVVAGIQYRAKTLKNAVGLDSIVKLKNGDLLLRNLQEGQSKNHFTLLATNPNTTIKRILYNMELIYAAPVIWHRKKSRV